MATVETKRVTADEFFTWLQSVEKGDKLFELERGEIVEMPSPGELHGVLCGLVATLLRQVTEAICTVGTIVTLLLC